MTAPDYSGLLADLAAEHAALDGVVEHLDRQGWATPTPAEDWDVRDSIAHLALTDDLARVALTDADAFAQRRQVLIDAPNPDEILVGAGRSMPGGEVLAWWRDGRAAALAGLEAHGPRDRLPWFAGPMSAMSFATARLMETWAHGQDVRDALGQPPEVSARLRHVADLGVRTRPFAYLARGVELPAGEVRVELRAPGGEPWVWGSEAAEDTVRGPALDFCLVVTQRVNPADTTLEVHGAQAQAWMGIAQAFAGPATDHRAARST